MGNSRHLTWNRRRTLALPARAAAVVAVSALLLSCQAAETPQTATPGTTSPSTSSPSTPSPSVSSTSPTSTAAAATSDLAALDTSAWTSYSSARYDLELAYPPDWSVEPAERDWTWEEDASSLESASRENFDSPDGTIRVSVWSAPLEPATGSGSKVDILQWVQAYCEQGPSGPCSEIGDRALDLCLEEFDCHPMKGVLVPFTFDAQAFVTGSPFGADTVTVVAVWRNPQETLTAPYLKSQRLLEAFLSTMDVWVAPATR